MNGFQYAVAAWLPIVIFPQTMAPSFREYDESFHLKTVVIFHGLRLKYLI